MYILIKYVTVETANDLHDAHTVVRIRLIYSSEITGAFLHQKVGGFLRVQLVDFTVYSTGAIIEKLRITINIFMYVQLTHICLSFTISNIKKTFDVP